ncbi:chemotaxis protein CheB [Vibrio vulnificus]|uniref:chemotaxis protein CheB n=1 Tax=Vibrio vulnificus TaxID=672 RepID=UPI000AFD2D10|nr:chemotaxis protein CheB [Vibrio vulnificus]
MYRTVSRPSIDVLFETAADYYRNALIGIVLTGANSDGALGLKKIKTLGGLTLVQSIDSAEAKAMPAAAMAAVDVDHILSLEDIGHYLNTLCDC